MIQKQSTIIPKKKTTDKSVKTGNTIKITALFHSEDNYIIEINSKYLLVSFMRFYC